MGAAASIPRNSNNPKKIDQEPLTGTSGINPPGLYVADAPVRDNPPRGDSSVTDHDRLIPLRRLYGDVYVSAYSLRMDAPNEAYNALNSSRFAA